MAKYGFINKYRPIRTDAATITRPLPVLIALWAVAGFLTVWGGAGLYRAVQLDTTTNPLTLGTPVFQNASELQMALGFDRVQQSMRTYMNALYESPKIGGSDSILAMAAKEPTPTMTPVHPTPTPTPIPPSFVHAAPPTRQGVSIEQPTVRRILLVGASSVQYYLGRELEKRLAAIPGVEVKRLGKLSTGLARPDVFDWPAQIDELATEFKPDLIVCQFGGNDCQNMVDEDGDVVQFRGNAWRQEYRRRIKQVAVVAEQHDAELAFLGMPIMRSEGFASRIKWNNEVTEQAASDVNASFIPTWDLTSDHEDNYLRTVRWQGREHLMRLKDGIHFSREGGAFVAKRLRERLQREYILGDPAQQGAVSLHYDLYSEARQKDTTYYVYLPTVSQPEGLPAIYLLHGAWDSAEAWPEHAHDQLLELSSRYRVAIIIPDGDPHGWYLDSPLVPESQIHTYIMQELLPDSADRLPLNCQRSIMGLSMGGHGAFSLALQHPGTFQSASSMSGVLNLPEARIRKTVVKLLGLYENHAERYEQRSAYHLLAKRPRLAYDTALKFTIGGEDRWLPVNHELREMLKAEGVPFVYGETPGAGHEWTYWTEQLPHHVAWHMGHLKD